MLERLTRPAGLDRIEGLEGLEEEIAAVAAHLEPEATLEVVVADASGELVLHTATGPGASSRPHIIYGSAFKPFAAIAMIDLAAERGIGLDQPLGDHGVGLIDRTATLRHLLEHRAGLPHIRALAPDAADLLDDARIVAEVRDLPPLWRAGEASAYHAISYSFVLDAVCLDLTGSSLAAEVQRRVLEPIGIGPDEVSLGGPLPEGAVRRPSFVVGRSKLNWKRDGNALYHRACYQLGDLVEVLNAWPADRCPPLSCGVSGTAVGLARFYAALVRSREDGPIPAAVVREVERSTATSMDRLLYQRVAWRCGFLEGAGLALAPPFDQVVGMSGFGGSIGLCDLRTGVSLGLVTDQVDAASVVGDAAREITRLVLDAGA